MFFDSLKRIFGLLTVIAALVALQSTVCLCAPTEYKTNSVVSESQTQQQLNAAQKVANSTKASFTVAEKTRYRKSLTANVKKMKLGLSAWEKFILSIRHMLERIAAWISRLFGHSPKVGGPSGTALTIIEWIVKIAAYIFVAAAACAILYGLYLLIIHAWRARKPSTKVTVSAVIEPESPKLGQVDELLSTADNLYRQGNYREALRHLYLASISLLSNAQIVVYSKDKTNRDYLRNLAKAQNPPALEAFKGITEIFDGVVYGGREAADVDYTNARKHAVGLGESL